MGHGRNEVTGSQIHPSHVYGAGENFLNTGSQADRKLRDVHIVPRIKNLGVLIRLLIYHSSSPEQNIFSDIPHPPFNCSNVSTWHMTTNHVAQGNPH